MFLISKPWRRLTDAATHVNRFGRQELTTAGPITGSRRFDSRQSASGRAAGAGAGSLRWGILSTADIARRKVIPGLRRAARSEVVAIGSRSLAVASRVAEELRIPRAHGSYEALLADPDVDAVYVPLPNHLHATWAIAAARAGKHVLCEKPS